MNKNTVSMTFTNTEYRSIFRPNAQIVEIKGKYKWLQEKFWNFLCKQGSTKPYHEQVPFHKKVEFNAEDIFKAVFNADIYLREMKYKATKIFIGKNDMDKLLMNRNIMEINSPLTIVCDAGFKAEIYHIPVIIVPHMNGILVI